MIYEIQIKDAKKTPFPYIGNGEFELPKTIRFKKGKNILIGENGSGKTTVIKILQFYTFCTKSEYSKFTTAAELNKYFNNKEFLDGIDVKANYNVCTYRTLHEDEKTNSDILNNIQNFANTLASKSLSSGQNTIRTISSMLSVAFSGKHVLFDKSIEKNINDTWKKRFEMIFEYFNKNQVDEKEPIFSLLLDEPDRNLSINNLKSLKPILMFDKGNDQIIAAIHNPVLIYALSKDPNINFIELTPGYLKNIKKIVEKGI